MELAEALFREGKRDQAREVLDYAEEQLPGYNIPYDYTSASMASIYYALGTEDDKAKADTIMDNVANNCVEYINWGAQLSKQQRAAAQSTLGHQSAVLGYVLQNFDRYHRDELFDKYYDVYAASVK